MTIYDYPLLGTALVFSPIAIAYYVANNKHPSYARGVMVGHITAAATVFSLIAVGMLDY